MMMVKFGNFLFHYRNYLFPLFYACLLLPSPNIFPSHVTAIVIGFIISLIGKIIRGSTVGTEFIARGGRGNHVYADGLETGGIFSLCRNPLYIGNILIITGLGVLANSVIYLLFFVPLFIFFYQAIVMAEEDYLLGKFGEQYNNYRRNVRRWLPNFSGFGSTIKELSFSWRKFLLKEYNSTFLWLIAAVLVSMKNFYFEPIHVTFQEAFPYLITFLVLVLIAYATVRYLKKSKRLT